MAAQYEKKLNQDKYKGVSKEGMIGKNRLNSEMKLREAQAKRIEEYSKNNNPNNFNLQVIVWLI